jgi:hypothetical protein
MEDLRAFGKPLQTILEWVGDLGLFCWRVAKTIVSPPFEGAEFMRQQDAIGPNLFPLRVLREPLQASFCLCKRAIVSAGSAPDPCCPR